MAWCSVKHGDNFTFANIYFIDVREIRLALRSLLLG
jgi:hypothetical protein